MIGDVLGYWGKCDIAIQIFIKQKCIRPKFFRYYMKNGNIYKSLSISNKINLENDSLIFKTIQNLVDT